MTAYTLVGQPSPKRSARTKITYIAIALGIAITTTAIVLSTVPSIHSNHQSAGEPARFVSFTVPTQDDLYYLDLDKYPIEDNIIQVFGASTKEAIKTVTAAKLLQLQQKKITAQPKSWSDQWLARDNGTTDTNTYACDQQSIPYPIIRHLAATYFPLKNADSFYDDDSMDFSKPFVLLPFSNMPTTFSPGQKICIRAIIPFLNLGKDDPHRLFYKPYPENNAQLTSPWWDTMLTTLINMETNATEPLHMQPWSGHRQLRQRARELRNYNNQLPEWVHLRQDIELERERTHVYEAELTVPHQEGHWELSSILEFVEARYNFELGPVTPYQPVQLPVYPIGHQILTMDFNENITKKVGQMATESSRNKSSSSNGAATAMVEKAETLLQMHLSLPLCKGFDHPGRWLPYPVHSKKYNLTHSNDFVSGLTRDGKYWAPYQCRYRYLSYEQFNRCASKKYPRGMHVYGDSNTRRSLKKFLSHGQWCKGWQQHIKNPLLPDNQKPSIDQTLISSSSSFASAEKAATVEKRGDEYSANGYNSPQEYRFIEDEQTRSCYCEDFNEPHWDRAWFDSYSRRQELLLTNNVQQAVDLGVTEWDDAEIDKNTTSLSVTASPLPQEDTFSVSSYKWDGLTYLNIPNWNEAVPSSPPDADVAIFSLGNWDAAFGELDPFVRDVERLVRQIKDHYHDLTKTKIIYRTAQYYCCRVDSDQGRTRQISGPRLDVFEEKVKEIFHNELNAVIWNTYALGEKKTWDEKITAITCSSNHVPADQVEIENQLLMNGLCNI